MVALLWDSINCSRTDGASKLILDAKSPAAVNETSSPLCSACWHMLHTSPEAMAQALRFCTRLCLPDTNAHNLSSLKRDSELRAT